jgi:hypothetical protein
MGELLTCLPRLTLAQLQTLRSIAQWVRAAETFNVSIAPMGKLLTCLPQTHTCRSIGIQSCSTRNGYVPALPANPHRPDGRIADMLAWTLACTTAADALANYRRYVPQRPRIFPSPPWEPWLTCPNRLSSFNSERSSVLPGICTCQRRLQTSHRINGIFALCFTLVLAGWRCLCQRRHGDFLIMHHQWEPRLLCARSCSKVASPSWDEDMITFRP